MLPTTCCYQSKKKKCRFFDSGPGQCGYMSQQEDAEAVQVWIVAGDMLFQTHEVFNKPAAVIIDEGIWRKGIRGIDNDDEMCWRVALDELLMNPEPEGWHIGDDVIERDEHRHYLLGKALQKQEKNGGFERRHLIGDIKQFDHALQLE